MTKFFLYLFAAFMLTSCDQLKKKDKAESDDEEVTTKKKKKALDEENTDDEETPKKKKKKTADEDETPVNDDEKNTNYTNGWSNADERKFLNVCIPEAEKKVQSEVANKYCNCFLKKVKERYSTYDEADRMNMTEVNEIAAECNK